MNTNFNIYEESKGLLDTLVSGNHSFDLADKFGSYENTEDLANAQLIMSVNLKDNASQDEILWALSFLTDGLSSCDIQHDYGLSDEKEKTISQILLIISSKRIPFDGSYPKPDSLIN